MGGAQVRAPGWPLWLELPPAVPPAAFVDAARRGGVEVVAGDVFAVPAPEGPAPEVSPEVPGAGVPDADVPGAGGPSAVAVRVCLGGAHDASALRRGLDVFGALLRSPGAVAIALP